MSLSGIPFLFGLLPIFLFLFYISKPKFRVLELLAFSILFYAINDAQCVVVFLAVIIINYVIALSFDKVSWAGACLQANCAVPLRETCAQQGVFVQDDGKMPGRLRAKPSGGI